MVDNIFELLNVGSFVLLGLVPSLWTMTSVPVLVYLVARWRMHKEKALPDAQLGLKLALAHFAYMAYQVLLVGLCLFVYALLSDQSGSQRETILRTSTALVIPAGLLLSGALLVYHKTNHKDHPMVGRMYVGVNRLQVLGMFALALFVLFQVLLQKHTDSDFGSAAWSLMLVYLAAGAFEGLRVKDVIKPRLPSLPPTPPAPTASS